MTRDVTRWLGLRFRDEDGLGETFLARAFDPLLVKGIAESIGKSRVEIKSRVPMAHRGDLAKAGEIAALVGAHDNMLSCRDAVQFEIESNPDIDQPEFMFFRGCGGRGIVRCGKKIGAPDVILTTPIDGLAGQIIGKALVPNAGDPKIEERGIPSEQLRGVDHFPDSNRFSISRQFTTFHQAAR